MIDLMSAVRAAVGKALKDGVPADLCPVYDDVPQNTQPPFVKVGAIDTENDETKGEQFERVTVEVIAVYRGDKRSVLLAMMHAARACIDRQVLPSDETINILRARFTKGSAGDAWTGDGVTYAGIMNFEIWAEPA